MTNPKSPEVERAQSPSIDCLARAQGVTAMADITAMFGTWPGETDDGLEQLVDELRRGAWVDAEVDNRASQVGKDRLRR